MKLLNHKYQNLNGLKEFIAFHSLQKESSLFVQMYTSNQLISISYEVRNQVLNLLPEASLLATTTAGIVCDGMIVDDEIILSFSIFANAQIRSLGFKNQCMDDMIDRVSSIVNSDTKMVLIFANTFVFDSTKFLKELAKHFPTIVIAGGNSGDDFRFQSCEVFTDSSDDCDIVLASISSKNLQVTTKCLMNWETIGKSMKVSKAFGTEVFEINGYKAIDVYRHYLGSEIADNLLKYGINFPLIYTENGIDIARSLVASDPSLGSISFAGEISEGTEVQFGFANIEHIESFNQKMLFDEFLHKHEAIYVYSCAARRQALGTFLNSELQLIDSIGPTSGFITYGEFFHDQIACHNNLLNITTTLILLNENELFENVGLHCPIVDKNKQDVILKALTTLISKTSKELNENIYYLEQFKNIVDESSIFSKSDASGVIIDANKNFLDISGYSRDELLGSPHNIIRHEEMPNEVFKEMWSTIQSGNLWKGMVKNKRKNGSAYYVLTQIMPVFYKNGKFREYIAIRNDVTKLEEYKYFLKHELAVTNKSFDESLHYITQYEKAINATTAILKSDTGNVITYANDKFCEISGYTHEELIGMNCEEMRHKKHRRSGMCKAIREKLAAKQIVCEILTNIDKNGKKYIVDSLFYPIVNMDESVIEHLQIMHDITEISKLNQEIVSTQKEVVLTMGAIGETRSKETGLHVKRVAKYSYLLAILYGLNENEANLLRQASPMHDIGKVGIPDNILNKPGKLTDEEFEIMKTHSQLGYEMLAHSRREILKASSIVAYTHHEKYDGSGYPQGLIGENIPIFGRITALVDVFDALGHDRVYKKAWEDEQIFQLFKQERGKHFDPVLVDLFFNNIDKFLKIRDRFTAKM